MAVSAQLQQHKTSVKWSCQMYWS